MKTIAHERRRFGYRLLKREGYTVNPKKLFRLYCEEKLRSAVAAAANGQSTLERNSG